jgi:septum formation protein
MQSQSHIRKLILASSSPYRKLLLDRLRLEFSVLAPAVDEFPLDQESPQQTVVRLAREKALAVSARHPAAVVIGSDQLAVFEDRIIGKPGSCEKAVGQLKQFSGQQILFLTAVHVCCSDSGFDRGEAVNTEVKFRVLSDAEIRRYVALDQPLDCAGGFKSEASGISLLESMHSEDPTAIIGLPLIAVSRLLRATGFRTP